MPYVAPSPIDFDAHRRALVRAVALGTGLPAGQVIMLEGEVTGSPRPKAPYVGLMVMTAAVKWGFDWATPVADGPGELTGLHAYEGVRTMSVGFDSFGRSHEEAYGVLAALQSALEYPPVASLLDGAGLAVYDIGAVGDVSEELSTAYEGRAHLDVTFGMLARSVIDLGRIDTIPLSGQVGTDDKNSVSVGPLLITRP